MYPPTPPLSGDKAPAAAGRPLLSHSPETDVFVNLQLSCHVSLQKSPIVTILMREIGDWPTKVQQWLSVAWSVNAWVPWWAAKQCRTQVVFRGSYVSANIRRNLAKFWGLFTSLGGLIHDLSFSSPQHFLFKGMVKIAPSPRTYHELRSVCRNGIFHCVYTQGRHHIFLVRSAKENNNSASSVLLPTSLIWLSCEEVSMQSVLKKNTYHWV